MAGGRNRSFRFGDTDEKLAEAILNLIAFTTQVSRENDIGHDLICVLTQREGNFLKAGQSFSVQVKSNSQRDSFTFSSSHERKWLENQEIPYFIGLVDREDLRLDLYSTWNIHNSYLWKEANSYTLKPGGSDEAPILPYPREEPECRKHQYIPLGKPALSITMQDAVNENKVENYRKVLGDWVKLERENIWRKSLSLKWIRGPLNYKTNHSLLEPGIDFQKTAYWNPTDFSSVLLSFVQATVSLRNMVNQIEASTQINDLWQSRVVALDTIIKEFWNDFPEIAQGALRTQLGQDFFEES